jgi:hypothetical protein
MWLTPLKRCGFFSRGFFSTLHYHEDDWKSPSGRTVDGKTWFLGAIVPSGHASYGSKDYEEDLEEAWKKIEKYSG